MGAERRDVVLSEMMRSDPVLREQYNIYTNTVQSLPTRDDIVTFESAHKALIDDLCEQRLALTAYLLSKVKAGDWHAVQDAASDIREIEAKLSVLRA